MATIVKLILRPQGNQMLCDVAFAIILVLAIHVAGITLFVLAHKVSGG